jgi:hypothetical protein
MTPREWPHWRRRLGEVQDLCLVAHEVDDVARAVLQLVAVLLDDDDERARLRSLVQEAGVLLTTPRSRADVERWLQRARGLVDAPAPAEDHGLLGALAPMDPRD